jgi:hypothetical protein
MSLLLDAEGHVSLAKWLAAGTVGKEVGRPHNPHISNMYERTQHLSENKPLRFFGIGGNPASL